VLAGTVCLHDGCLLLPLVFDTNNAGVASLVLMDSRTHFSNTVPSQTTSVTLTRFAPDSASNQQRAFAWAEATYPQLFSPPAQTQDIAGYSARVYAGGVYLGFLNGQVYLYGPPWGGMVSLGALDIYMLLVLQAGF
jgi:hypothetical protein